MARSRNIKPGFCENEILGQLPVETRLLFITLPMFADREGRLEDRPLRIRAKAFPYDTFDAEPMLQSLNDAGFILRYEVENVPYIQILNFEKHQSPHVKEAASTIPAPDKHQTSTVQAEKRKASTPPDSLIPDSLIPDSKKNPCALSRTTERFAEFWEAYPVKRDKKKARDKWKSKGLDSKADSIISDVKTRAKADGQWLEGYIPLPTTYLNGERWEDEISAARIKRSQTTTADDAAAAAIAYRRSQGQ